ncbi:MAG: tetratricopeptide (TPR) repeat protein [Algoriphagus sp.]|jgi:tetratricopeptide (TPR) repeat protein
MEPLDSILSWLQINAEVDIGIFEKIAKEGIKRAVKTKNNEKVGNFHTAFTDWHHYNGLYAGDSLIKQSELALFYYLKTDKKAKIAETRKNLAHDYIVVRRLVESQNELLKTIVLYEEFGNELGVAKAYRNLSNSYIITEEPEKAFKYLDKVAPVLENLVILKVFLTAILAI